MAAEVSSSKLTWTLPHRLVPPGSGLTGTAATTNEVVQAFIKDINEQAKSKQIQVGKADVERMARQLVDRTFQNITMDDFMLKYVVNLAIGSLSITETNPDTWCVPLKGCCLDAKSAALREKWKKEAAESD